MQKLPYVPLLPFMYFWRCWVLHFQIEKPSSQLGYNQTTFHLNFNQKVDDINGPISCYYVAVVPLPSNVSIESLPDPSDIVVESCARVYLCFIDFITNNIKAFQNNLMQGDKERKVYFAYIAESYKELPIETVLGDGEGVPGVPQCSVQYLSRHKAEDRMLRPGMKYTGFLIVRVDRNNPYGPVKEEFSAPKTGRRFARRTSKYKMSKEMTNDEWVQFIRNLLIF